MASIKELCGTRRYGGMDLSSLDYLSLIPQYPLGLDIAYPFPPEVAAIMQLINQGVALFENPMAAQFLCQTDFVQSGLDAINLLTPSGLFTAGVKSALSGQLGSVLSSLTSFNSHVNGALINPLNSDPGFLPQVMSGLAVQSTVTSATTGSQNACNQLSNVMGSILGDGGKLLDALSGVVNPLLEAIAGGVASLNALLVNGLAAILGPIQTVLSAIGELIAKEVAALSDMFQSVLTYAKSTGLFSLFSNPCAQAVYNSAGSPELLNAIPTLPRFP